MADQRYQNHPLPPPPPSHSQGNQYAEESSYDYRYQQQSQHPQQQYPEQQHQQQSQQQYQQQPTSPVSPTSYQQVQPPAQAHASPKQLPGPPQRQPSKQRTFSFQSNKSQKSNGSHHNKSDSHETHAEKEAHRLHSKADPTMAISEAEPSTIQAMTKNSLAPLRSIQHRDSYGNAIAEPDRSNPTRSRWERPLDTIRSFEAAIDGGYSRKSFIRQDSDNASTHWNKRNSYYGSTARFPQESYYGSRPMSMIRSDSSHMDFARPQRGSLYDGSQANGESYTHSGNGQGHGYGPGSSRQRTPRMMSEPMPGFREHQQQQIYPLPHKDRSYETVTTAAGSGGSDQAGYQTDPTSSDNSSVHRTSPPKRQEPVNDYGIGFNQPSSFQPAGFNVANGARNAGPSGHPQQQQRGPPPPPHGQMAPPQVPPKSGNVLLRKQTSAVSRPEAPEKRKSWFSRRFSKAA